MPMEKLYHITKGHFHMARLPYMKQRRETGGEGGGMSSAYPSVRVEQAVVNELVRSRWG